MGCRGYQESMYLMEMSFGAMILEAHDQYDWNQPARTATWHTKLARFGEEFVCDIATYLGKGLGLCEPRV